MGAKTVLLRLHVWHSNLSRSAKLIIAFLFVPTILAALLLIGVTAVVFGAYLPVKVAFTLRFGAAFLLWGAIIYSFIIALDHSRTSK
ncbi:MAG TPA: hypothetical protein VGH16_16615 [Candidatus Binatia bacterium]|jgi:hypothetical protein